MLLKFSPIKRCRWAMACRSKTGAPEWGEWGVDVGYLAINRRRISDVKKRMS